MKNSNKIMSATVAGLLALGVAGGAYAAKSAADMDKEKAEIAAVLSAKLSVADAAKIAETETGDRAVEVEIDEENGVVLYEVETLKADGTETEVHVDAMSGKIIKVAKAMDDENDDKDDDGDNENDESETDK